MTRRLLERPGQECATMYTKTALHGRLQGSPSMGNGIWRWGRHRPVGFMHHPQTKSRGVEPESAWGWWELRFVCTEPVLRKPVATGFPDANGKIPLSGSTGAWLSWNWGRINSDEKVSKQNRVLKTGRPVCSAPRVWKSQLPICSFLFSPQTFEKCEWNVMMLFFSTYSGILLSHICPPLPQRSF